MGAAVPSGQQSREGERELWPQRAAGLPGGVSFSIPSQRGAQLYRPCPHTLLSSATSRCPPPSLILAVTQTYNTQ